MHTRLKQILWAPLLSAVVANAAPIVMDMGHSHVEIAVNSTIISFVAQLKTYDVLVTVTPQLSQIESAVFRSKFGSIKTGNADRDRDMNEWQQTDKFPDVVFILTAPEPAASGYSLAHGRLRFHGVERSVSFPISVRTRDQVIGIDGDMAIDTRDYGLPVISKFFFLKVDPVVRLHFHLQGTLAGS